MPAVCRFCKLSRPGEQLRHQHQVHKKEKYTMSDTLKTNQDITDGDVQAVGFPNQDLYDEDADAISFQPLFQDDEDDSALVAPPNRRLRVWMIVVSSVLLLALIGGGALFYM